MALALVPALALAPGAAAAGATGTAASTPSLAPPSAASATPTATSVPRLRILAPTPELAALVRREVDRAAGPLARWTGAAPQALEVEVAATRQDFAQRTAELGGPSWAAGLAYPRAYYILVRSPGQLGSPEEFAQVLRHELLHLYLEVALKGRPAPRWLEEGLAMHFTGEEGWGLAEIMARGVLLGKLFTWEELGPGFPAAEDRAALAYAQAYYQVNWLQREFGAPALARLITGLSQDLSLTTALQRATGYSLTALEERFSEDMASRFSWLVIIFTGSGLWTLIALAAAGILVYRRGRRGRRGRDRRARGREEAGGDAGAEPGRVLYWGRQGSPPPPRGEVLAEAGLDKAAPPAAGPADAAEPSAQDPE
ncbi:MAG: hypothetical protein KQJ78_15105 [Deltaproteobacteria bacterium]|nr:hypothetical protein [Deltaproteobacteria bacterium]